MATSDNIYYNFNIKPAETGTFRLQQQSDTRVQDLVANPNKYEIAVERFSIPATLIPIFLWKGDDYFYIRFTYGGNEYIRPVLFQTIAKKELYGDSIWHYQDFIDMINTTLKNCFNDLKTANPALPITDAPFITLNANTKLCSFNCEQAYQSQNVEIGFNLNLYQYFPAWYVFVDGVGLNFWFNIKTKNFYNNTAIINGLPYFTIPQEYGTLFLWNDFQTILFETDTIPSSSEFLPSQKNDTRKILTDFQVQAGLNDRQAIQYYPQADLRWYDLQSNKSILNMDLKIYWEDKVGKVYPLYLSEIDTASLKVQFRKKLY